MSTTIKEVVCFLCGKRISSHTCSLYEGLSFVQLCWQYCTWYVDLDEGLSFVFFGFCPILRGLGGRQGRFRRGRGKHDEGAPRFPRRARDHPLVDTILRGRTLGRTLGRIHPQPNPRLRRPAKNAGHSANLQRRCNISLRVVPYPLRLYRARGLLPPIRPRRRAPPSHGKARRRCSAARHTPARSPNTPQALLLLRDSAGCARRQTLYPPS